MPDERKSSGAESKTFSTQMPSTQEATNSNVSKKQNIDWFTRMIALAALGVSAVAAYYSYSCSPYFYASIHDIEYSTFESNNLTKDGRPQSGSLKVYISNKSPRPARNILVIIEPISGNPTIECDEVHKVFDGVGGKKLVQIERIPGNQWTQIRTNEAVTSYPKTNYGVHEYQYSAWVNAVQCDFGPLVQNVQRSKRKYECLADDKGEEKLSSILDGFRR